MSYAGLSVNFQSITNLAIRNWMMHEDIGEKGTNQLELIHGQYSEWLYHIPQNYMNYKFFDIFVK